MNLAEARDTVLAALLHEHATHGTFRPQQIDRAIRFAGNDFCETTHAVRATNDVTLAVSDHEYDLTAVTGMDRFLELNFLEAHIDGAKVELAPSHVVQQEYVDVAATPTGRPKMVGFEGPERAWVYPEPDQAYTLRVLWWQPFTSFSPIGMDETAAEAVTLNIPDQWIDNVLRFGAATALYYADPRVLYGQQGWANYESFRNMIAQQYRPDLQPPGTTDPRLYQRA